ncbi:dihydrolipoamide acetyltransferase family protein [Streptomyces sp. TS71-3]|uniref:dihydrolipoamide acetyltransferase family protein n=1 Tax=Streptomyces sp. TS71-3 TaxID=2733862 RepID=UPI001B01D19E|nr:dihydrolipoamide acetyltransferase family protein [Streptomyces sp. TS71-3]GHJ40325.1 dihydrolipoamide acetyltransferase component of pyruvate dehydrogenase complex [Streptomyces sp. TS71-3]
MPDVGEGLTEAEILKWYVQPGEAVSDGQVVCEVETAKAAVELPIPYDGVVRDLRFAEGTTVDVGQVIISVDVSGAAGPADGGAEPGTSGGAPAPEAPEAAGERQAVLVGYGVAQTSSKRRPRKSPVAAGAEAAGAALQAELNGQAPVDAAAPAGTAPAEAAAPAPPAAGPATAAAAPAAGSAVAGGRPLAKPPVRKLAKDLGVDLAGIVPSGPEGIITREDVHAAAAPAPEAAAPAPAPQAPAAPAGLGADTGEAAAAGPAFGARETRIPVKGVRKATAQAMVASAFTAPHVTEWVTVDVTRTMELVDELKRDAALYGLEGLRINPMLLIARALLVAIKRNPEVNASWDEERQEIVRKHYVNLGIAAATPRGLIVPNIKDAGAMALPELAQSLADLVSTAREGRTSPGAMQGGTVTITNVGVFGIDSGTPILNPGESAILAVGAIKLQPWVHEGEVVPRQVTTLALSFDHRLVDGELGSKVLADVAAVMEQPKRLISWG